MEMLHKKALAPGLHNAVAAASWSGGSSSSPSSSVAGSSTSNIWGRNCRPTLALPKITSPMQGLGFPSVAERRTVCRCSSSGADGLSSRIYISPQQMITSISGARAAFSTADYREGFSSWRRSVSLSAFGAFEEGLERLCRVIYFRKCGGRLRGLPVMAVSSWNGIDTTGQSNVDLELEVHKFMQQSSKPDAFPTRQDLIIAGRTDLVNAIDEEGGWLAAGWDEKEVETNSSGGRFATDKRIGGAAARGWEDKGNSRSRQSRQKSKARTLKRNSATDGKSSLEKIDARSQDIVKRRVNAINVVREVINAVDDEDGRGKGNQSTMVDTVSCERSEGFSILERMQQLPPFKEKSAVVHGMKKPSRRVARDDDLPILERLSSLLSFTEELKLKRPQRQYQWVRGGGLGQASSPENEFSTSAIETATISSKFHSNNGFQTETLVESFPAKNSVLEPGDPAIDVAEPPKRRRNARRKKRAAEFVEDRSTEEVNESSDWTHHVLDKREMWMFESRSKSDENSFEASVEVDSKSFQNRIHTLSAKLVDARAALQSGREALWQTNDEEFQQGALSEFIDAEDTLEFRENAIMHARHELNTTRAEITALEGNLKVEIMEARKILEEKHQQTERARSASKHLRAARVVWPNHANEVFLTGSFNGWNGQIKMEKSNAGVFVVSLPLHPGRYEIKFVVDGSWRVDTNRPVVYSGGFENNVLNISEC